MVLLRTADGDLTQPFGPSTIGAEPEMWANRERAYWLPVGGTDLVRVEDMHPGIDIEGDAGDPLKAQERGRVVYAGWKDSISGFQYEVQVNPTFRYSANHLMGFAVMVGDDVRKGQTLGFMGMTGVAFGVHAHVGNSLYLPGPDGVHRTFLYDPQLFLPGGRLAGSKLILPEQRQVRLKGLGANLRLFPPKQSIGRVYARSMDPPGAKKPGIYRLATMNRLAPVKAPMDLLYWHQSRDYGRVAVVHFNGERLAIRDEHVEII